MSRCPICDSLKIVIVISPQRRAFCTTCGARWIQDGSEQLSVRPGSVSAASPAAPAPAAK